ncbi:ethanolamine ammonia-lyase subunit EutC [Pseudorhodoplanes sp.]|uniref:ethanolamine ammonia-lyase subunit EutC n=1 Tax=Pseudorhodoplanes sp. TaxID=1934341 RepID=UPI003D0A73D1
MNDKLAPKDTVSPIWRGLRTLTAARIGLARTGASIGTGPLLEFQLAHARARDAVHEELDAEKLRSDLSAFGLPVLVVDSAVGSRRDYLMRPDLGRRLSPESEAALAPHAGQTDVALVVADGLSARAVQTHAAPVLAALLPALQAERLTIAPLVIARNARVAIGDAIAQALRADAVTILIGERPGLSAPDSMGAYLTWRPNAETTDADRNCLSNIRTEGIGHADSAFKIAHLLRAMRMRRFSGVRLKDESDLPPLPIPDAG